VIRQTGDTFGKKIKYLDLSMPKLVLGSILSGTKKMTGGPGGGRASGET